MALFLAKTLEKHPAFTAQIPANHLALIQDWQAMIRSGALKDEKSAHPSFIQKVLVELLGYTSLSSGTYSVYYEKSIKKVKSSGSVDVALGKFSATEKTISIPFELKGLDTPNLDAIMSGRNKSPVQQAWEYANGIEACQWVLVSNYQEIRLYATSKSNQLYEKFDLLALDQPAEYARFQLLLAQDHLLGGTTLALLHASEQADKDITAQLYADYKAVRESLITHLIHDNPTQTPTNLIAPAQKLLDRVLFVAFAEDRGLIPAHSIKKAYQHQDPYNPRPIYENFKGLFTAIDKGNPLLAIPAYNGGLFAPDAELDALTISDSLCEAFKNIAEYDFASDVSVTVLGHIFEQSIADLEEINENLLTGQGSLSNTTKATAVSGKRKQHGVVYTPDHITAFIVEQTLGSYLSQQFNNLLNDYATVKADVISWKKGKQTELNFWYAWQERLQHIKVVDPACGSGAFLVSAFDYLHAEYQRANTAIAQIKGNNSDLFDLNKTILNNNLFGVDINPESIEITKLSLWLKTAEYGKPLTSLDSNLKDGNSLGWSKPVTGEDFCWQTAFPEIFAQGGFDVVLGNPPYVRQERFSHLKSWLEDHYDVYHGVADLYAYFFELGVKLLKPNGMMGYISSSTFFKTGSGEPLRQFLRSQTSIKTVVDFGDLQIFEGVTTYPAIVILASSIPASEHHLKMLVLKNKLPDNLNQTFEQQHNTMPQGRLTQDSWQLEDDTLANLRQKLTTGHKTLKEVYGSPLYGIKTGFNEAFVIDRATRDRLISADPKSHELIKLFLEGKDLKKWHAQPRELWLIFTRRGTDIEQYPAIKQHLEQFKTQLMPKPKDWQGSWEGRKAGPYQWWEIQDTVGYHEEFSKPSIAWADISNTNKFCRLEGGHFLGNTGYILPSTDWFLYGWLNSKLLQFVFSAISPQIRGGFYRYIRQYIDELPIPTATEAQKNTIGQLAETCQTLTEQRYAIEQKIANRLISNLCPKDKTAKLTQKAQAWWTLDLTSLQTELKKSFGLKASDKLIPLKDQDEWEDYLKENINTINSLNQQITDKERALNQAVYELFGLTEEEVKLVEGLE